MSGSSSRKGKKSNSDKPKQPQRGLGVAQLEKIRLHGQIAACNNNFHPNAFRTTYPATNFNQEDIKISSSLSSPSSYSYHPSIMMGLSDRDRSSIIYGGDSQPTTTASWNPGTGNSEIQPPNMNIHLVNLPIEDPQLKRIRSNSLGSSSQNSESSDTQEVDLELRLSI